MIRIKLSTQKSKNETQKALAYALNKASLIVSNRCQNGTDQEFIEFLAKKFKTACTGKQQNTSFHEVLSFHKDDKLTPEQAIEIAKELYEKTHGLNREHTFAVHNDTDELHIHFIWAPRDFNKKIYNQVDDYRIIENELNILEKKYNLFNVENRKAINPDIETNVKTKKEQILEARGVKLIKHDFKNDIKKIMDKETTTTGFIASLYKNGYDIIHNGNNAYSVSKDGHTFKASTLGISYASLIKKLKQNNDFKYLLENNSKREIKNNIDLILSTPEKTNFLTKSKYQTVLVKNFDAIVKNDKVEYFYKKSSSKKSFEYYKDPSSVSFKDLSNQSIKAGIQRIIQDMPTPGPLEVSGSEEGKKKIWLEFKMMNLEAKGYTLNGYEPNDNDLKELKKRKEQYALLDKKWKKDEPKPIEPIKQIIEKSKEIIEKSKEIEIPKKLEEIENKRASEKELEKTNDIEEEYYEPEYIKQKTKMKP